MNNLVLWRIVWKEYRVQRAFWWSLVAISAAFLSLIVAISIYKSDPIEGGIFFLVAVVFANMYALGCGATLFATEHENNTFAFQQSLPASAGQLFWGKVVFSGISIAALYVVLVVMALIFGRGALPDGLVLQSCFATLVTTLELFTLGVFFSLILKRPLRAAVLAVTVSSISIHFVFLPMLEDSARAQFGHAATATESYLIGLPFRSLIVLVIAALDFWLARRWFNESIWPGFGQTSGDATARSDIREVSVSRSSQFGRLVWQTWRQSSSYVWTFSGVFAVMIGFMLVHGIREGTTRPLAGAIFSLTMLGPIAGACTFLSDNHRQSFRFLVERGVSHFQIWASRVVLWFGVLSIWILVALGLTLVSGLDDPGDGVTLSVMVGWIVIGFTVGQACSIFFRNGIIAGVVAFFSSWAFYGATIGAIYLARPIMFFLTIPIPLIFLASSRLRLNDWILERITWRGRIRAAASLLIPMGLLWAAFIWFRATEVTISNSGFSTEEFLEPQSTEEKEAARLYSDAWSKIGEPPGEALPRSDEYNQWLDDADDGIQIALKASEFKSCSLRDPDHLMRDVIQFDDRLGLGKVLVARGDQLRDRGELQGSLKHYLAALRMSNHFRTKANWFGHKTADKIEETVFASLNRWAAHSEQTSQSILAAMDAIDRVQQNIPSRASVVKLDYLFQHNLVENVGNSRELMGPDQQPLFNGIDYVPWEAARSRRIISVRCNWYLQGMRAVDKALSENLPKEKIDKLFDQKKLTRLDEWSKTSPIVAYTTGIDFYDLSADEVRAATRRRAARVVLALQAWRADHGELPTKLDELTPKYLKSLPLNPYVVKPFYYFADGVPQGFEAKLSPLNGKVLANRPILWINFTEVEKIDSANAEMMKLGCPIEIFDN